MISGGSLAPAQQNWLTSHLATARVGLLAGLIGALVHTIVSIPIDLILGPMERAMAERFMEMAGSMPPEIRDVWDRFGRGGSQAAAFVVAGYVFGLMLWLFGGAIFSTLEACSAPLCSEEDAAWDHRHLTFNARLAQPRFVPLLSVVFRSETQDVDCVFSHGFARRVLSARTWDRCRCRPCFVRVAGADAAGAASGSDALAAAHAA